MKFLTLPIFLLLTSCGTAESEEQTLRERIRAKVKGRLIQRMESKPAPETTTARSTPGTYTLSLVHEGIERFYILHIPKNYNAEKPAPLLVAMHGGGGDMNYQADDSKYKLITKSEEMGFVALFPNGTSKFKSGKFATWNAGKCCGYGRDQKIDDVGFIRSMIQTTKSQLSIDEKKVFATGMSNGGMMSYRLACEMSDVFTAVAPVAGTDNTIDCKPVRPISLLHIHAQNDDHVLFNGGIGKGANEDKAAITDFNSVPASITKWVQLNSCKSTPQRVLQKTGAYCDEYTGCKKNVSVKLCVTEMGGHSWPGGNKPRGEKPSQAISANDVMWDFFQSN